MNTAKVGKERVNAQTNADASLVTYAKVSKTKKAIPMYAVTDAARQIPIPKTTHKRTEKISSSVLSLHFKSLREIAFKATEKPAESKKIPPATIAFCTSGCAANDKADGKAYAVNGAKNTKTERARNNPING